MNAPRLGQQFECDGVRYGITDVTEVFGMYPPHYVEITAISLPNQQPKKRDVFQEWLDSQVPKYGKDGKG